MVFQVNRTCKYEADIVKLTDLRRVSRPFIQALSGGKPAWCICLFASSIVCISNANKFAIPMQIAAKYPLFNYLR